MGTSSMLCLLVSSVGLCFPRTHGHQLCPATKVFSPAAPPCSHLPEARPYTLIPMSSSSSPGHPGAPLHTSQMALVTCRADEKRSGFGSQGPTPEPCLPEIQKNVPSCVRFYDSFLEPFINISVVGMGAMSFQRKETRLIGEGCPNRQMFLPCPESLPQFPSSPAGPLQHLGGGGPAWSADRKRKGQVAGGGAPRVRCTGG